MRLFAAAACFATAITPALASDYDVQAAYGVATIIASSPHCDFLIDQAGMDKHMADAGLQSSAALGFISAMVTSTTEKPSDAECTVARSTAKALGLIK